jgi:hypothetical protein
VHDSNGPDVKLRGTAQTIAEKYMQLGRDAHASGDPVMAESYYQHADHYYRLWLAMQPAGQPIQFSRRNGEEEFDDDGAEGPAEGEEDAAGDVAGEGAAAMEAQGEGAEPGSEGQGEEVGAVSNYQNRPRREFQQRDGNRDFNRDGGRDNNRDGGNRYRNRWGRRNDRYGQDGGHNGQTAEGQGESGERGDRGDRGERTENNERFDGRRDRPQRFDRQERFERSEREARGAVENGNGHGAPQDDGNWEAPSFLRRPMPVAADEGQELQGDRPARGRRPRNDQTPEDMPQGD